ncbi:MAG: alpha/beta fold hydrolase [Trueperaceae bacterium]
MPHEFASEFVEVAGLRTHVLRAGDSGPPLVLLHGTAIDSARLTYGASLPQLGKHFRVYAPDWPGYGQSQPGPSAHGFRFLEDFLHAFLDAMGLPRAHLAGFSMGGAAALGLALDHPQRVDKLVLIDSYGLGGTVHLPLLPYLALRVRSADRYVWSVLRRNKGTLRWFLATFVLGNACLATRELVDEVHRQLMAPGAEGAFMDWLRGEIRPGRLRTSYRARLRNLRPLTLILHGARDLIVPAYRARRAVRLIPDARLVLVPGCGHWLPREAPGVVERKVMEFLG